MLRASVFWIFWKPYDLEQLNLAALHMTISKISGGIFNFWQIWATPIKTLLEIICFYSIMFINKYYVTVQYMKYQSKLNAGIDSDLELKVKLEIVETQEIFCKLH